MLQLMPAGQFTPHHIFVDGCSTELVAICTGLNHVSVSEHLYQQEKWLFNGAVGIFNGVPYGIVTRF